MGSSLPNHDDKNQRIDTKEREKEQEEKPRAGCKLAQKI